MLACQRPFALALIAAMVFVAGSGCGSQRGMQAELPVWTHTLPVAPGDYVGIASAPLAQYPGRAMDVAKDRALSDLARTIGVKVESTNTLNTLQQNELIQSSFREQSRSTSDADLEGYELVGTFTSNTDAWAYYRLSRAKWASIVAQRKAAAVEVALGFYQSALEAEAAGDVLAAIDRHLRGMEALSAFWGELNEGQTEDGQSVVVDRACLDGITRIISGLRLEASPETVALDFSTGFKGTLTLQAFSDRGAIANLPLDYRYNRGTLPRTGTVVTNPDGLAEIALRGFESHVDQSEIHVEITLEDILGEGHLNGARELLDGMPVPELHIPILLQKPTAYLDTRESIYGSPAPRNALGLSDAVAEVLHDHGFPVTETEEEADLVLEIVADTEQAGAGQGFHTAYLNARVKVIHARTGEIILQKNLNRIKGVQLDWETAANVAYDKAGREIKGRFIADLLGAMYR